MPPTRLWFMMGAGLPPERVKAGLGCWRKPPTLDVVASAREYCPRRRLERVAAAYQGLGTGCHSCMPGTICWHLGVDRNGGAALVRIREPGRCRVRSLEADLLPPLRPQQSINPSMLLRRIELARTDVRNGACGNLCRTIEHPDLHHGVRVWRPSLLLAAANPGGGVSKNISCARARRKT